MPRSVTPLRPLILVHAIALACAAPLAAQESASLPAPTPVLADTVRSDDLTEDNGFAVLRSEDRPYTGMVVDRWAGGTLRLSRAVVEGRAQGLWMEWYESGRPRYMATWRDGRGEGMWTYFHESGQVSERSMVRDDRFDGLAEGWHPNGIKAFDGVNVQNQRVGEWRFWTPEGDLDRIEVWDAGELVETRAGGDLLSVDDRP